MQQIMCYAMSDEGPDKEFSAGWNAYVGGRYPKASDTAQFFEGWVKAYKEYNGGEWPDLKHMQEADASDLG
jgi:hypothetical protein